MDEVEGHKLASPKSGSPKSGAFDEPADEGADDEVEAHMRASSPKSGTPKSG
jgi:hypothetical protein